MRWLTCVVAALLSTSIVAATFPTNGPRTTNNDDSCDIALLPAATLLLPYFEVDVNAPHGSGETTLFTITNTYRLPQAVKVTLWTDWAMPVLSFSIYLTGYDVQSINLYDVLVRGRLAPDDGTGSDVSPVGDLSGTSRTSDFDNPLLDESSCTSLPIVLPPSLRQRIQSALTTGTIPAEGPVPECRNIGAIHANAIGYATIDVLGSCANLLPLDPAYFASEIRYDNVLIGDYLQVKGSEDQAQVNPLVHIRAIPEGGTRAAATPTNLSRTFYGRLQPAGSATADRRQPLPSVFAGRWIAGGAGGFEADYKIWREGRTPAIAGCGSYVLNGAMNVVELVRFDEEENPETLAPDIIGSPPMQFEPMIPAASRLSAESTEIFPSNTQNAVAGWMYLNLDNPDEARAMQSWVVVSMRSEGRFSGDMDAQAFGNGCSDRIGESEALDATRRPIGPLSNTTLNN